MLQLLYKKYGDLNDRWNAFDFYRQRRDRREEAAAAVVQRAWGALQRFQA